MDSAVPDATRKSTSLHYNAMSQIKNFDSVKYFLNTLRQVIKSLIEKKNLTTVVLKY